MASITRTIKIFGAKADLTLHVPTNKEFNEYSNDLTEVLKNNDDPGLIALRVKYFDAWLENVAGVDKADILDQHKSGIMYQLFEKLEITEKN